MCIFMVLFDYNFHLIQLETIMRTVVIQNNFKYEKKYLRL